MCGRSGCGLRLLRLALRVYSGRHLSIREVEYFDAARVESKPNIRWKIYADGEYVCRTPVEVGVHPAALKIVTP